MSLDKIFRLLLNKQLFETVNRKGCMKMKNQSLTVSQIFLRSVEEKGANKTEPTESIMSKQSNSNPSITELVSQDGEPSKFGPKNGGLQKNGFVQSNSNQSSTSSIHKKGRSKSPHSRKAKQQTQKKKDGRLDIIFKAIHEKPLLNQMTREERIRAKLQFFKLEHESLETTKDRIQKKVKETATRFGPKSSNMKIVKMDNEGKPVLVNHFLEMMAIEAEFGCIIEEEGDQMQQKKPSTVWQSICETMLSRSKKEEYKALLKAAQKHKDGLVKERNLELIKQQIARGVKNLKLDRIENEEDEQSDKMDVVALIAEEQRRQQERRMLTLLADIKYLDEKSVNHGQSIEAIRELTNYKYPTQPSMEATGREILSKVNSKWEEGVLDDMKIKSQFQTNSRKGSLQKIYKKQNPIEMGSINIQDSKVASKNDGYKRAGLDITLALSPNIVSCNTARDKTLKTFDRRLTAQNSPREGIKLNKGEIFIKMTNIKDSTSQGASLHNSKLAQPVVSLRAQSPSGLPQEDSFYMSFQEPISPILLEQNPTNLLSLPLNNRQWKQHLAIKQIHTIDELNAYAGELAVEMSIYCHNRLLNIHDNIKAILCRFKQLKSRKKTAKNVLHKSDPPKEKSEDNQREKAFQAVLSTLKTNNVMDSSQNTDQSRGRYNDFEILDEQKIENYTLEEVFAQEEIADETNKIKAEKEQINKVHTEDDTKDNKETILTYESASTHVPIRQSLTPSCIQQPEDKSTMRMAMANSPMHQSEQIDCPVLTVRPSGLINQKQPTQEKMQTAMVMRTVNDKQFDVTLITEFDKNDYKKTKMCLQYLKPVVWRIEQSDHTNFDFNWTESFKFSIFAEDVHNEIVPILLVLKKFSHTNIINRSLRSVLARRFVDFKVKFGLIEPEEMSIYETVQEQAKVQKIKETDEQNSNSIGQDDIQRQDSLYKEPEWPKTAQNLQYYQETQLGGKKTPNSFQLARIKEGNQSAVSSLFSNQIKVVPMNINDMNVAKSVQSPSQMTKELSNTSMGQPKFYPPKHAYILPNLAKIKLISKLQQQIEPFKVKLAEKSPERLIKTSHTGKRSKTLEGEIYLGSVQSKEDASPVTSSALPSAENKSLLISTQLGKKAKHKKTLSGSRTTRKYDNGFVLTTATNQTDAWPNLNDRHNFVPGSIYTAQSPLYPKTMAKSMQSGAIPAQSYQPVNKDVRRQKSRNKKIQGNREMECILAKILTKTERKDPRVRLHNPNFYKTIANSMGFKRNSFGSKGYTSVLPDNCALKAFRAAVSQSKQTELPKNITPLAQM